MQVRADTVQLRSCKRHVTPTSGGTASGAMLTVPADFRSKLHQYRELEECPHPLVFAKGAVPLPCAALMNLLPGAGVGIASFRRQGKLPIEYTARRAGG